MILTCPSCGARYLIASDTIGETGRDVRCTKCLHQWHQPSEKDSLDELIQRVKSETVDIDFGDGVVQVESSASASRAPKPPSASAPRRRKIFRLNVARIREGGRRLTARISLRTLRRIAGGMVGLAVFMTLLFGLVQFRGGVAGAFPSFAKIYTAAGFPLDLSSPEKLVLDRIRLARGDGGKVRISGSLINLAAADAVLRPLEVRFLDAKGSTVLETQIPLREKVLKGEDALPLYFDVDLSKEAEAQGVRVQISLPREKF